MKCGCVPWLVHLLTTLNSAQNSFCLWVWNFWIQFFFCFCFDFTYVVRVFLPVVLLLGFVTNCLVVVFPRFCLFIGKGYVNSTLLFVLFRGVLLWRGMGLGEEGWGWVQGAGEYEVGWWEGGGGWGQAEVNSLFLWSLFFCCCCCFALNLYEQINVCVCSTLSQCSPCSSTCWRKWESVTPR